RFGKLPWHRLFEPSIALARGGFALSAIVHANLVRLESDILNSPGFNTTYTDGHGKLLKVGDTVYRPELANTLEEIARDGPDAFYKGRIARSLVKTIRDKGGILTTDDFASYKAVERKPIETYYHGRRDEMAFGLRPSPNNKIVPGKRPLSSTSATIIEHNGHVELVVGGSGGSRILTAVLQVIVNVLDFDMRLDQAKVDAAVNRVENRIENSVANAYTTATKSMAKIFSEVDKNSSAAVLDATKALGKALTPEVREKVKKAINSVVDSSLNALL
ncbi:hypothetical protein GGF43_003418, partial [Coemansia sp. RSA 2618]